MARKTKTPLTLLKGCIPSAFERDYFDVGAADKLLAMHTAPDPLPLDYRHKNPTTHDQKVLESVNVTIKRLRPDLWES